MIKSSVKHGGRLVPYTEVMRRIAVFLPLGFLTCVATAASPGGEGTAVRRVRPTPTSVVVRPTPPPDKPAEWFVLPDEETDREMAVVPTGAVAGGAEIHSFTIDRARVSELAYTACVGAKRCKAVAPMPDPPSAEPMRRASWNQARAFCLSRGKDLPTKEQWERARKEDVIQETPVGSTECELIRGWYTWLAPDATFERNRSVYNSRLGICGGKPGGVEPDMGFEHITFRCVREK